jgi:pyroglutamyl-peptidase
MHPWLVVGFTPFGGERVNPSGLTAEAMDGLLLAGRRVIGQSLPVAGDRAWDQLTQLISAHDPAWILAMGVSGRGCFSVETGAWNDNAYPIPDDEGQTLLGPVMLGEPERLFTKGPARKLIVRMASAHLPCEISQDPGRYVCNHVYFRLLASGRPSIFLHGPAVIGMQHAATLPVPFSLQHWHSAATACLEALALP